MKGIAYTSLLPDLDSYSISAYTVYRAIPADLVSAFITVLSWKLLVVVVE